MKSILLVIALLLLTGCENKRGDFLLSLKSDYDLATSVDNLETIIEREGFIHFGTIDHSKNAVEAEMSLKPNRVVSFGNPKAGTLLMQCNPSMGLELPLKMHFSTDFEGITTLTYTNPEYWSLKHNIKDKKCLAIIIKMRGVLKTIAQEVTQKSDTKSN
jgi:uncharacterized protein (DUF302 family)